MRSSLSCSACVLRLARSNVQRRVFLQASALSVTTSRSSQISTKIRQPKHSSGAITTKTKTGRKGARASIAISTSPHSPTHVSEPRVADSTDDHRSQIPYPENDLSSTRPARLDVPDGPVKEFNGSVTLKNRGSYLYRLGKAYLGFYKTGFRNVWSNYKEYRNIRERVRGTDIHEVIRYGAEPPISRREFQLYLRTQHDLKKLIPFGCVFFICGEFTPFVILALGTAVVPYTCRIPKQVRKDLQKTLSRIENVERIGSQKSGVGLNPALAYVHGLDPFGFAIRETPVLGPLLWRYWVEPKFKKRMDEIICDTMLIVKEGGVERLEPEEQINFCINIKDINTIKRRIDRLESGLASSTHDSELEQTQKVADIFSDGILVAMTAKENEGPYQPASIFSAAAQYAGKSGQGVYMPSANLLKTS